MLLKLQQIKIIYNIWLKWKEIKIRMTKGNNLTNNCIVEITRIKGTKKTDSYNNTMMKMTLSMRNRSNRSGSQEIWQIRSSNSWQEKKESS